MGLTIHWRNQELLAQARQALDAKDLNRAARLLAQIARTTLRNRLQNQKGQSRDKS